MAVVLVIGTNKPRSVREELSHASIFAVAPTNEDTTRMLIGPEPLAAFYAMVSSQLRSPRLSIYQTGLAVRHARSFFGRDRELSHILNRAPTNYLIVGGRQIGKSSLMLEIKTEDRNSESMASDLSQYWRGRPIRQVGRDIRLLCRGPCPLHCAGFVRPFVDLFMF